MTGGYQTSGNVLMAMRAQITGDSPLLKKRLKPAEDVDTRVGFSDLFGAACNGEITGFDHYLYALEYIFEGYLLHYGKSRLLDPGSVDFALLAGDYMYARGLRRITRLNDPACIRMLADLVSFCSFVHAEKLDRGLAMEVWAATSVGLAARATGKASAADGGFSLSPAHSSEDWLHRKATAGVLEEQLREYSKEERIVLLELRDALIQNHRRLAR